ncbi:hypothetical protein BFW38_15365 [Terasakiispira papahanaumokuakeensis]|uniref:DUF4426 domain-containing protein n=1 Tax=Terasakiispira papahanaumokuakeensis TaxID=197479 RepID=A0A1E2VCX3_9GAMM|nr:DUF4426 domain-containing protein [Terasakiispira papahanaumokuakeensis]ODC04702.1 hypothetical protein BFW38_15365 [Terasakiispira papahanaumokuakeensis]
MRLGLAAIGLWLISVWAMPAYAERYETYGDYQIHYNAVTTSFLQPEVAQAYNIVRSRYQALVNIAVLKVNADGSTTPVNAVVTGEAGNLAEQSRTLSFRTIREQEAIYSIATFRFTEDEPTRFRLQVRADPNQPPYELTFIDRFYAD